MALLNLFKRSPKRMDNISVYYISEIVDGDVFANPIGIIPRFTDEYEKSIKAKHQPKPEFGNCSYINEELNGSSVILFWQNDRIEAINFIAENEARAFPGLTLFPNEDLVALDKALLHFPRNL